VQTILKRMMFESEYFNSPSCMCNVITYLPPVFIFKDTEPTSLDSTVNLAAIS